MIVSNNHYGYNAVPKKKGKALTLCKKMLPATKGSKMPSKAASIAFDARDLYEPWMEPDWTGTPTPVTTPTPVIKPRSKFKYCNDYAQQDSRTSSQASRSLSVQFRDSPKLSAQHEASVTVRKAWKPVDFVKFHSWITNGTLKDLNLAQTLLFDE